MKKISIIVPVYNVENYLKRCLNSLLHQTFKNMEIICIDDASTDYSGKILDEYASVDDRVRVFHFEQNRGTLCARIRGMEAACGAFILFVDSDDALETDACEKLYALMTKQDTDFIHFGTTLHAEGGVSEQMLSWVADFLRPQNERMEGNLIRHCFMAQRFDFNITNKIWKSTVIRQALPYLQKTRLTASEDRYAAFVMLYFAHSYFGVTDAYYHYYLGIGVTGGDILSREQFEKRCTGVAAYRLVLRFLEQAGVYEKDYQECAKQFGRQIVWDCVDCWYRKLLPQDRRYGFQVLCSYFQPDQLTAAFARVYFEQEKEIYDRIRTEQGKSAAVYDRYLEWEPVADGPIRRCIDSLRQLGYTVYLYTDEKRRQENPKRYREVCGIPVFYLPDAEKANWGDYESRAERLYERIKTDRIQKLLYASPSSHTAWLDLLLAQMAGVETWKLYDREQYCRAERIRQKYEQLETEYQNLCVRFESPRILLGQLLKTCRNRYKNKEKNKDKEKERCIRDE